MELSFEKAVLKNIEQTFHEPAGILSRPYLDPGGVYSKSLWDWDSYWTCEGLFEIAEKIGDDDLKMRAIKYGAGAVDNFFDHQCEDGSLPILMNDSDPDCFDCRESRDKNMAKPVFGQFCDLLARAGVHSGADVRPVSNTAKWCSALKKFYDCYERRYLNKETGLYVWANDVAIGVDDDPATWGRPPFSSANIFLNCFLYADLKAAARFERGVRPVYYSAKDVGCDAGGESGNLEACCQQGEGGVRPVCYSAKDAECDAGSESGNLEAGYQQGEGGVRPVYYSVKDASGGVASGQGCSALLAEECERKAAELADAINEFCWDERDGMYYSLDVLCRQNLTAHRVFGELNVNLKPFWKGLPLKVMSWVSFLPLWSGIATKERAERMVEDHLTNERRFWCDFGIRTLSADERMYSPSDERGNPSNWLGPVWIISNYLVWRGLRRYGFDERAGELASRTKRLLEQDYERNGYLHENYNPETGEGIAAPRFWNWNILAAAMD